MQKQRYTLSDVYHAAKTERRFNYAFWLHITFDILGTHAMHGAGFILVIFATVLITIISLLGFLVVLPSIFVPGSFTMMAHNIWGVFAVFCIYFHYYMAVFTRPGSPGDAKDVGDAKSADALLEEGCCDQTLKLCKKCNYSKPKRTHHCSICNACVLKMDHHCPWVSNCVGYRNYRYFYGFLFWATVGTMYVSALSGYMIISPGSLLFPAAGSPSVVTRLFGTREHNVYAILYDTLAGIPEKKEQLRLKRVKKGLRGGERADFVPSDSQQAARRLLDEAPQALPDSSLSGKPLQGDSAEYVNLLKAGAQGRYLSEPFNGPADVFRSLQNISSLDWLADQDMLLFMAFMLATGVWIGTGTMLMMHTFLVCNGYTTLEYFESDAIIKKCKDAGVRFKHPYDRGIRQNFEEVFGPYPWYLMLLPSVREPPVVVFPPLPDLFPPREHSPRDAEEEDHEYRGHEEVMFNSHAHSHAHSYAASSAGAPRWEHNTHEVASDAEEGQGLITDRPQEPGGPSGGGHAVPDSGHGVTPRNLGASSSRKSAEQSSPWDAKSK